MCLTQNKNTCLLTFSCNWIQRRTQITRSLFIHINIIESRKSEERCRLYPNSTCRQTCMFVGTNKSLVLYTIDGSNESVVKWRWEMYLSISHYHFIVYTPRFIIYIVPLERQCEDNELNILIYLKRPNLFYLMILPSSICLRQIFSKKNEKCIYTHLILFTFIDAYFFSYKSLVDQMIIIIIIGIKFFFLNI